MAIYKDIEIYANSSPHQITAARLFKQGLEVHGIKARIKTPHEPRQADLAVMWGYRYGHLQKMDFLVMELGYLGDRLANLGLGFNGLNGRATFSEPTGEDRAAQWRHLLQPVKRLGQYVLIMGQVPGDASIKGVDFRAWIQNTAEQLRALWPGYPVYFRPHPLGPRIHTGLEELGGSLAEALAGAHLVATYNSNSGVDAILEGVAVSAADPGSMVYELASHDGSYRVPSGRQAWLERISFAQWNRVEILTGKAWEALEHAYRKLKAPGNAAEKG